MTAKAAIRGGDGGDPERGGGDLEDAELVDKLPCGGGAGTLARARVPRRGCLREEREGSGYRGAGGSAGTWEVVGRTKTNHGK